MLPSLRLMDSSRQTNTRNKTSSSTNKSKECCRSSRLKSIVLFQMSFTDGKALYLQIKRTLTHRQCDITNKENWSVKYKSQVKLEEGRISAQWSKVWTLQVSFFFSSVESVVGPVWRKVENISKSIDSISRRYGWSLEHDGSSIRLKKFENMRRF